MNTIYANALFAYREWQSDQTPHDQIKDFGEWCEEQMEDGNIRCGRCKHMHGRTCFLSSGNHCIHQAENYFDSGEDVK